MNFNLFDSNGRSIITKDNLQFKDLKLLIRDHCEPSNIDSNIYYVRDYTSQLSYVILQPFYNDDSSKCYLSATLKSKKIPEGIGFPRLLISSKAKVLESLEKYSIAKYHKRKLVSKYGDYGYPSTPFNLPDNKSQGYLVYGGFNHYIFKQTANDAIIISTKVFTLLEVITSFSYVFTFLGLLMLPYYFARNGGSVFKNTLSLALKIQLLLVTVVFFSLFAFGWGSGIFVRNQYEKFTTKIINEKLVSLETELRNKIGEMKYLDIYENGNYINFLLLKLSRVFVTDINLYDPDGHLLATSRPKVFNIGLTGEQMNPQAFNQLKIQNKSEFSHQENIGELNYVSAYLPFFNSEGNLLAFVNLQHFGQQNELENQIQQFLVAIINVFVLLLAISIILAIVMSNWVTKPLRLLQTNLSLIKFGKKNQIINYDKNDEIGALVKEYNNKLKELEQTADQLARSERESAWRDMAKQVAHEIKNPLTPMKLSIQQMMRVFEKENPEAKSKIDRLANSLIEQIDGLTKIANEFSNFAKMPAPVLEKIELTEIIQNVVSLFKQEAPNIEFFSSSSEIYIDGDKDQLIRAINNLLQNSLQSFESKQVGEIKVEITQKNNLALISISDKGRGIPMDQQDKIFVPYFTTKTTGTGIGLSMTKQIIENHNGKISFKTKENHGTTFTIELPILIRTEKN
jgi:signal transduction histidine kinase